MVLRLVIKREVLLASFVLLAAFPPVFSMKTLNSRV